MNPLPIFPLKKLTIITCLLSPFSVSYLPSVPCDRRVPETWQLYYVLINEHDESFSSDISAWLLQKLLHVPEPACHHPFCCH